MEGATVAPWRKSDDHISNAPPAGTGFAPIGYIDTGSGCRRDGISSKGPQIAAILAVSILLSAIPRTALLGAICITGFLGGAICAHVRLGELASPAQWICVILGVMTWAGVRGSKSWQPWLDYSEPADRQ